MTIGAALHWLLLREPVWELAVAVGTIVLAIATGLLGWATKKLANDSREEVKEVGRQIAVQEKQLALATDPVVWPVTPLDWAEGNVAGRNGLLHLANGGGGPAFSVEGIVTWTRDGQAVESAVLPVTIAAGADALTTVRPPVETWHEAAIHVGYDSIDRKSWRTTATFEMVQGTIVCRVDTIVEAPNAAPAA